MKEDSKNVKNVERVSLSTRNKAKELAEEVESKNYAVVNLSEVSDMSRSFTDEFFTRLSESDVEVVLNNNLKKMRDAVMSSKA